MNRTEFADVSFPTSSKMVFDKMLWTDWYDGITGGLVVRSQITWAFRLDLLAWDSSQKQRIFVLSRFDLPRFDQIVALLSEVASPTWPKWDPAWPSGTPEKERLRAEIEEQLKRAGSAEYVIASEASFETIYGVKQLEEAARNLLPQEFNGLPFRDNFDYWKGYIGFLT